MQRSGAAQSTAPVIRGGFLAESLQPGTGFDGDGMRITRCSRFEVGDAADYQPTVWTLVEFEAPAENAAALADEFAGRLLSPRWYVNWNSDTEATVVFPGQVFRYQHGDAGGRQEAAEHGRRCGVPESQLDWTD